MGKAAKRRKELAKLSQEYTSPISSEGYSGKLKDLPVLPKWISKKERRKKKKKSIRDGRSLSVVAQFPSVMKPLFKAIRYKVLYGGRGGTKSWNIARALLTLGMMRPLRILCAREVMNTIKQSVHQLLQDQIEMLGYQGFYDVKENEFVGRNGTQIIFTGLRSITSANIKSFEGADICWVEEGQAVTKKSWNVLIPTIRKEGSEIWVSFNPELDTDDTYVRFVVNTPPDAWVQEVSYKDNPWRTKVLESERLHMKRTDPEEYKNIWLGKPKMVVAGAIYAREVQALIESHRFRSVPYDPALKVHAIWDLGWNDQTAILLVQRMLSEVRIIGYLEDSFMTLAEWVKVLKALPYVWGYDWLPHDAEHHTQQTGKKTITIIRNLGRNCKSITRGQVEPGIRVARMMFPRLYIDNTHEMDGTMHVGAGRLLECLKRYRRSVPTSTDEPASPVHDQYSHGADTIRQLAQVVDEITNDDEYPEFEYEEWGQAMPGVM